MRVSAYFFGTPEDILDRTCHSIFNTVEGVTFVGSGNTLVGAATGERDIQYDVPDDRAEECRNKLKSSGFRLQPTRYESGTEVISGRF